MITVILKEVSFNPTTADHNQIFETYTTTDKGLTQTVAKQRLTTHGPNILTEAHKVPLWKKLLEPFLNVFVYILIVAAIISIIAREPFDAIIIGVVLLANATIYYVQRFSSDRVLDKLKSFDKRLVSVLRDGEPASIDASQLVPGDVVLLEEGLRVPADGRLIHVDQLETNESALTGESAHVKKNANRLTKEQPIFAQHNMVFQGTLVASGKGAFVVTATGNATELGRIAHLIPAKRQETVVEKTINKLFTRVVIGVGIIAVIVFLLALLRGISLSESLRYALSLTVSSVPEGLPLAISVVLIFGARRMARQNALVRHLRAIEAFGQTSVIITDKTGTLTKNQLELNTIWQLPGQQTEAVKYAHLSVAVDHFSAHTDSLEQALAKTSTASSTDWIQVGLIPFDQHHRLSGAYWRNGKKIVAVVKGAPESLLSHAKITSQQKQQLEEQLNTYLANGYRVLAIGTQIVQQIPDKYIPSHLNILGLLVFGDTIRPQAKRAVATAHTAGIKIIMLTGDHVSTARHVGLETGIITTHDAAALATEDQIKAIKKEPLKAIENIQVLARVLPEYKYEILRALQHHHVVVMTGDGINDVPALTKANIGVAMGSGTDAAKEASDVILLNDNFASIVRAIEQGRTITANIKKMVYCLFSTNLGTVIIIIFSLIANLGVPLLAAQILWINLVVDGIVVIPLGLEQPEPGVMKQKPHRLTKGLFTNYDRLRAFTVSSVMAAITLCIYVFYKDIEPALANTVAFSTLAAMQWANAINSRSFTLPFWKLITKPNYRLLGGISLAIMLQIIVLTTPLGSLVHVDAPIRMSEVLVIACAAITILFVDAAYKVAAQEYQHRTRKRSVAKA